MLFWKRKKKITLRCLTVHEALPQLFPITRLSKALPSWWREAPAYLTDEQITKSGGKVDPLAPSKHGLTIKHCYAIQKLWENSLAIPLWSDLVVAVDPDGRSAGVTPSSRRPGDQHPNIQHPGMMSGNWVNWKVGSPWLIYTEEYVPFLLSDPFYHNRDHMWMTMPGETEFFHQHHSNINMAFRKADGESGIKYEFAAGDVIAYMTPRTDREVEVVCETVTPAEYERLEWARKVSFHPARFTRSSGIGGCPLHRG